MCGASSISSLGSKFKLMQALIYVCSVQKLVHINYMCAALLALSAAQRHIQNPYVLLFAVEQGLFQ